MTVTDRFNDLNNRDSTRKEIESLLADAKAENSTEIVFRLSKVLNAFPEKDLFTLTIKEYKEAGLSGAQHTGDFKEALDDCGRLKKGYKFHFGKIVKLEANAQSKKKPSVKNSEITTQNKKVIEKTTRSKVMKSILVETPTKAQKEVKKVASKKIEKPVEQNVVNLSMFKNIVNKEVNYRPVLSGVYLDNNTAVGTNGHVLGVINYKHSKSEQGKILNLFDKKNSNKYIDGQFPRYKNVIPKYDNFTDYIDLSEMLANVQDVLKVAKDNGAKKDEACIILADKVNEYYNVNIFFDLLNFLYKSGSRKIKYAFTPNKAMVIETDTASLGLVMPVHKPTKEDIYGTLSYSKKGYNENHAGYGLIGIGLFGYIQTEVLETKNLYNGKSKAFIQKSLKNSFETFNKQIVVNQETKKSIEINKVAKGKILFGGANIDSKTATAISFLPHLIIYGKLVNKSLPKPHHVKKYRATEILSFQSKLKIDNKTEYFIITVIDRKNNGLKYYIEMASIKKSVRLHSSKLKNSKSTLSNGVLSKDNKNNTTIAKNNEKGLGITKPVATNRNSLAYKMANKPAQSEFFAIANKDIASFLGKVERKTKESVFISLTGGQGSMKTRMCFQFMNALAQNYKVGHASIEEHPESVLYFDKAKQYLNNKSLNNIESPEITNLQELQALVERNDVIVIDSYTKMQEMVKGFEVDKDLRKKYNGKLFIVIFQQTTDGKMRGGSKSQFDADVVLFTKKEPDYRNNYIYADKNRYQNKPLDGLHFNIFDGKLVAQNSEIKSAAEIENTLEQINKLLSFKVS